MTEDIAYGLLSAERERNLRREHHRLHPDLLMKSGRVCIVCLLLRRLSLERDTLREIEELARQGKIHSESVRVDQEWPVHETIHRFSVIREKART